MLYVGSMVGIVNLSEDGAVNVMGRLSDEGEMVCGLEWENNDGGLGLYLVKSGTDTDLT